MRENPIIAFFQYVIRVPSVAKNFATGAVDKERIHDDREAALGREKGNTVARVAAFVVDQSRARVIQAAERTKVDFLSLNFMVGRIGA